MRLPSVIVRRKYQKPNKHRNKITPDSGKNFPVVIHRSKGNSEVIWSFAPDFRTMPTFLQGEPGRDDEFNRPIKNPLKSVRFRPIRNQMWRANDQAAVHCQKYAIVLCNKMARYLE